MGKNNSSVVGKSFNKKALINNRKLKIPKTKLSMEIRNKRKAKEIKYSFTKFIKLKLFLDDINKQEIKKKIIEKNLKKSLK